MSRWGAQALVGALAVGICALGPAACSDEEVASTTASVAETTVAADGGQGSVLTERRDPVEEPSPALLEFAAAADRICYANYVRGIRTEDRVERIGRRRAWPGYQIEAAIHFGYEEAWLNERRMMHQLGDPPQLAGVMRRWVHTISERAQIRHEVGDAWLAQDKERAGELWADLDWAKYKADLAAERMPFQTCGTGGRPPQIESNREAREDLPLRYAATMKATPRVRRLVDDGTKVYDGHRVAGDVAEVVRGETTVFIEFRVKPEYARKAVDTVLGLYQAREDPNLGWFAMTDAREAAASDMAGTRLTALGG
jgi:hypothetical protein